MEKKSGTSENATSLPSGGGAVKSIGDSFQPNLAMGGGSYKVPVELPQGPGGFSPKIDLIYNTGFGNGPMGMGWIASVPYVERNRTSPFLPQGEIEYSLSGAETLVPVSDEVFVPFIGQTSQQFRFDGTQWNSRAPNLVAMRFGSTAASRVEGVVDGQPRVVRWLLDRVTFPGERQVDFEYETDGAQRYLRRIRWSVFRLEWEYEDRPDVFSQFDAGFEVRTRRRLRRLALHQDRLAPETLTREILFDYVAADRAGASLLQRIRITGFRFENGALQPTSLAPLTFTYTGFSPDSRRIVKFDSNTIPPPSLGADVTLLDYRGTALPGILRMNGIEATFWENRGRLRWGPPQRLAALPQGLNLGDDQVRFADLTGNGTADLVVGRALGGGFYPHDPEQGFQRKQFSSLTPSFDLGEEGSYLLDLDGDRVIDLLTFRNGTPMAFFNRQGERWEGPVALPAANLPNFNQQQPRLRFADMNGDGMVDMVMLQSRQITYWPGLGNGRWGAPRVMTHTPEFDVPNPDEDIYLADLDGDGTADLILVGSGEIRIFLNALGERFSDPIVLERAPRLGVEQFLLADLAGSGTPGFIWCLDSVAATPHVFWYLDPLNGVKPYLLQSIDNGAGLTTTIEYTTSVFERTADLDRGRRWSGYLPFPVHVVKRMTESDRVTGQTQITEYRYHDGHYDGRAREYLGFAEVESIREATEHQASVWQRFYFHNRGTSARDLAFIAGKGQPHRSELIDPATGEVCRVEESVWEARPVETVAPDRHAYLAQERSRESKRFQAGTVYESERIDFQYDLAGNVTTERRSQRWKDSAGTQHIDELIIDTLYATHPVHGLSSFPTRMKRTDGSGRVLKHFTIFYDGPAFVGLPFGQVNNGFKSRQTEIALTTAEINESYGGVVPPLIPTLYRSETDPELGAVFVKDVFRYRNDAAGNQLETLDLIGHRTVIAYDAESIHPVSISEDGGPMRVMTFDPIAQQATRIADLNNNIVETRYDGLGNIIAVFRRGADPSRPTETYEYRRDTVPHATIRRLRLSPDDVEPGAVKFQYHDGAGRVCQERTLSEDGRWAVGKQEVRSVSAQVLREFDAYYSPTSNFEATPPVPLVSRSNRYDFAGRVVEERLFDGGTTRYIYDRNETRFYDPLKAVALVADPATPPSRMSRANAGGKVVSIVEIDAGGTYEERRTFDALGRLKTIHDSRGHVVLDRKFDLWSNCLRCDSAEAGTKTSIYDAANNEVLRTDADGRAVYTPRDLRGRITEVRTGGPSGSIEEAYSYDTGPGANLKGRLARVAGSFGTVDYSYSVEGDATSVRRTFTGNPNTYEIRFGYDHQRRVRFVTYPDGTRVDYNYHPTGMLASIPGYIQSITYGPTGKRERIVFANGLETRRRMTAGDYLLTEILTQVGAAGPKFQHLLHHLDALGRVFQIDDLSNVAGKMRNNQTFEYDERNRVSRATGRGAGGDYDFRYRYDELSNLTFSAESFAEDMDYGLAAGDALHPNRLIKRRAAATAEYEYDNSGRLVRDPALGNLSYDARGRLVRVDKSDGAIVEYRYDHNDRRTESRVTRNGATTIRYECDGIYLIEGDSATKVVFDDDRRLAIVPQSGDPLLHHLDRLGNVNVVSNLNTGAFVGHDEYTPYGRLSISIVIQPHFQFQGAQFSDGTDLVLLGARHYRPMLGRFISPDNYLLDNPEKMAGIIAASNLYLYALANPVNFTDPTGQIAFLVVLLIAVIVGAALGAIGAALNGAQTWDEWLLWIIGGAIGAALTVLTFGGFAYIAGASAAVVSTVAIVSLVVWSAASLLGSIFTPLLDASNSEFLWGISFFLKWVQSPILTTVGLIAAIVVAAAGGNVDFRRGMLFIEVGAGGGALTLGAVAWTQSGRFNPDGTVPDNLARHESYHSRTVAALGELGFYFTYVTVGAIWGAAQGGDWNDLNTMGCGNPFEKTAHTFTGDPAVAVPASSC